MKAVIKCLITGGIIAAVGVVMLIIVISIKGCSVNTHYEMLTYNASADNTSLSVDVGAGKVTAQYYDGDKVIIEYPSSNILNTDISEHNGKVSYKSRLKWYVFFGNVDMPETVIKLPESVKFNISVDIGAGTATLGAGLYGTVKVDISAGTFNCQDLKCDTLDCEVSAGKVMIEQAVCNSLDVDISAGSVNISKLTSSATDIDVSAGSADIGFTGAKEEYRISTSVSAGKCNVGSQSGTTDKKIDIDVSAGSVTVKFNV